MLVVFTAEGVRREIPCGLVLRRTDSYLDKCVRAHVWVTGVLPGHVRTVVASPALEQCCGWAVTACLGM